MTENKTITDNCVSCGKPIQFATMDEMAVYLCRCLRCWQELLANSERRKQKQIKS